jgi:CubicO group peptidase (beta-lactamase class C family)
MHAQELDRFLKTQVRHKSPAGCVCWIGTSTRTYFHRAYGFSQITPAKIPMYTSTLFDTASITKPIVTAVSTMLLYEDNQVSLNDTVQRFVPQIKGMVNGGVTIKELLVHTSGLPAWFPLYILPEEQRLEHLGTTCLGKKDVVYSCLNYILLGEIIERIAQVKLDAFFTSRVVNKLGLGSTMFCPSPRRSCAATEMGNTYEQRMAQEYGTIDGVAWRHYLIKHEVHDGNAFYAYKGVAGNAGLFSNTHDLALISRALVKGGILTLNSIAMMFADHTHGSIKRGLGWEVNAYPDIFSCLTFSHTGFTGTMLFIAPDDDLIVILLANAVHPVVRPGLMDSVRRRVMELVRAA